MAGTLPAMAELLQSAPTPRVRNAKVRVVELAEQQWGVVNRSQLHDIGLTGGGISRWIDEGRLHRVYPGVFAVGHSRLQLEGKLAAALFYAGPGAALSGVTAASWFGMLQAKPQALPNPI
jgi:putative AbiEi antitoxin of type IV toxin-antitoxin system